MLYFFCRMDIIYYAFSCIAKLANVLSIILELADWLVHVQKYLHAGNKYKMKKILVKLNLY